MDSVGGGSSSYCPGSIFCGGGVVAEIFRDPYSVGWQDFSVNCRTVTDPEFGLFKHVLCFARIMSTLPEFMSTNCPNWGGQLPPVPYSYGRRTR